MTLAFIAQCFVAGFVGVLGAGLALALILFSGVFMLGRKQIAFEIRDADS